MSFGARKPPCHGEQARDGGRERLHAGPARTCPATTPRRTPIRLASWRCPSGARSSSSHSSPRRRHAHPRARRQGRRAQSMRIARTGCAVSRAARAISPATSGARASSMAVSAPTEQSAWATAGVTAGRAASARPVALEVIACPPSTAAPIARAVSCATRAGPAVPRERSAISTARTPVSAKRLRDRPSPRACRCPCESAA